MTTTSTKVVNLETFVIDQKRLLSLEREAEITESHQLIENTAHKLLEKKGVCLLKLQIGSHCTGLFGRTVVSFEPLRKDLKLPSHNISSGDIVGINPSSESIAGSTAWNATGVVNRVKETSISISIEEPWDALNLDEELHYKLVKLTNDVTYRRLKRTLDTLPKSTDGRSGNLINLLFEGGTFCDPHPTPPPILLDASQQLKFYNDKLDASQKSAVLFAICQKELAIIHGPPGTGKTTTVVEIILQAVKAGNKVLACAPSNVAVDNLVEKLAPQCSNLVRLGHPARLLKSIQHHSLDAKVAKGDESQVVNDVRKDLDKAQNALKKTKKEGEKRRLRDECRNLRKELKEREGKAVKETLRTCPVVLCTITTAGDDGPLKHLTKEHFNIVVIDECSQALETACWTALLKSSKAILAGDPHQLPPTIISTEAAKQGLEITLMERAMNMFGDVAVRMLTVQYRMNEKIMQWSSDKLYDGKLQAHESVQCHLLNGLSGVQNIEDTGLPLLLVDTAGCGLHELDDVEDNISKGNPGEAELIAGHVKRLVEAGVGPSQIAVITPYNLQVDLLRQLLSEVYPQLEIRSVDGFQGREKEAVILSLVRSNSTGDVGFLKDQRRLNVAVTRARRHLAVFCDSETVSNDPFIASLIEYLNENGEVHSAHIYEEDLVKCIISRSSYTKEENSSTKPKEKKKNQNQGTRNKNQNEGARNKVKQPIDRKPEITDEQKQELSVDFEKVVLKFSLDSAMTSLEFPSALSPLERLLVHELAEKYKLNHISVGEGVDRHIVISKASSDETSDSVKDNNIANSEDSEGESSDDNISSVKESLIELVKSEKVTRSNILKPSTTTTKPKEETCKSCKKSIPSANMTLHVIQCEKQQRQKENKKKSKPKPHVTENLNEDEQFDKILNDYRKQDSVCNFPKCKTSVVVLGQACMHCRLRFCLSHHIPEVHGCGLQAKIHARQGIKKAGIVYPGSGPPPSHKPNAIRKAQLRRKLDHKLDEMSTQRTGKAPDKSN